MWFCSGGPGRSQLKNARHKEMPIKNRERQSKENESTRTNEQERARKTQTKNSTQN